MGLVLSAAASWFSVSGVLRTLRNHAFSPITFTENFELWREPQVLSLFKPTVSGDEEIRVASILPFIRLRADFDDETTRIMGEAFDAARESLQDRGQPEIVYGIIAKRIIEAAKKGERDPIRLRDAGLAALGYKKDAI